MNRWVDEWMKCCGYKLLLCFVSCGWFLFCSVFLANILDCVIYISDQDCFTRLVFLKSGKKEKNTKNPSKRSLTNSWLHRNLRAQYENRGIDFSSTSERSFPQNQKHAIGEHVDKLAIFSLPSLGILLSFSDSYREHIDALIRLTSPSLDHVVNWHQYLSIGPLY